MTLSCQLPFSPASCFPTDVQKFPLRMKDNDLLVTELYRDPAEDAVTALSVHLTPKSSKPARPPSRAQLGTGARSPVQTFPNPGYALPPFLGWDWGWPFSAGAGLLASSPLLLCIGHNGNWIEIAYGTSSGMVRVIVQHPETVGSGPQLFQTFAVHRSPVTKVMLSEKHLISGTGLEEEGQMGEASQGSSPSLPSFFLPASPHPQSVLIATYGHGR